VVPTSAILIGAGREDNSVGVVGDEPLPPALPTGEQTGGEEVWSNRTTDLRWERQR
jgi:hypothetical protein